MQIGIFVTMAGRKAGGPETYERCLVRSLAELDRDHEYTVFCLNRGARDSFGITSQNVQYHVLWPNIRWLSIPVSLPVALWKRQLDLFHATFVPPPFSPSGYVFTLLDPFMFTHPEYYTRSVRWRLQNLTRRGLQQARLILCISEYTRDTVAEMFGIAPERLAVTYLGVQDDFYPRSPDETQQLLRQKYRIYNPYFLFVGELVPRKNMVRTLQAFDRFRHDVSSDFKLVVAGRKTWAAAEIDATIEQLGLAEHIVELGYVPDQDLAVLYSGAEMLVFPSLDEGFGFPVVEAMACGTAVLTSNSSSLPEVAGDAALLVDPYSVQEIADGMQQLASDSALRDSLRVKGLERAKHFTWRQNAEQTLDAYERALR